MRCRRSGLAAAAAAAYFAPLAKTVVRKAKGWQVWAVERRENLLEDHSVLNRAKRGKASGRQLFDYYLGWLDDQSITPHFQFVPDAEVAFAREWGMRVEIEDLRRVVKAARKRGRRVVMGGHSLGGSITTAYATWDFAGRPGARGLSGLVYIDGGSSPTPVPPDQARQSLQTLASGDPRGWDRAGEVTPIRRYAQMFSGWGLKGLDGTAWYHPQRLTIDSGAVAAGNANPAQEVLDVRATHGDDLPERLRIYAFGASLGGQRVLDAAKTLARQSGIPKRRLTLVNRARTYAHNDPSSAAQKNAFVDNLVPFLERISPGR